MKYKLPSWSIINDQPKMKEERGGEERGGWGLEGFMWNQSIGSFIAQIDN